MSAAQRAIGVDLESLTEDANLLRSVGARLGDRWRETDELRSRAVDLGFVEGEESVLDPHTADLLSVLADLPRRLRDDLEALGHVAEAVEAARDGLAQVCSRVADILGDAVDAIGGPGADVDDPSEPDDSATAGMQAADIDQRVVVAARSGARRIDDELAGLDSDLVLIGGH